MKNNGYLLLEFLLGIFIFSIIIVLLLVFLERIQIIQNYKTKSHVYSENNTNIISFIKKSIKERDKEEFLFQKETSDFFLLDDENINSQGNTILFKINGRFLKIKFKDKRITASSSDNLHDFKKQDLLGITDFLEFKLEDSLLIICYRHESKEKQEVINIK